MMALNRSTDSLTLSWLLEGVAEIDAVDDRLIQDIRNDSRQVEAGDLFFACKGLSQSGADFIDEAIDRGACAVLADASFKLDAADRRVPLLSIPDLGDKLGLLADRFFNYPSSAMNVIGVTGTNGKTSVSYIIAQALMGESMDKAGIIGTLGSGFPGKMLAAVNTTPDAISVHRALSQMREEGAESVAMEVSSHALTQGRVVGVNFDTGIFTNLSQEHLDYHGDMQNYAEAKRQLFSSQSMHTAIINTDDEYGRRLATELDGQMQIISYGLESGGNYAKHVAGQVTDNRIGSLGLELDSPWGKTSFTSQFSGRFNASNLLASFAALCVSGMSIEKASEQLSGVRSVPGRMECFSAVDGRRVIVDYAHTPDALEKALKGLKQVHDGNIITVTGCGGDRDKSKRPVMAEIAEKYSTVCIFTNDNPRTEDPLEIIEEMLAGVANRDAVKVIDDRASAIRQALEMAGPNDAVLVAGKGHETYQEVGSKRIPFSDRQLVRNLLGAIS